MINEFEKEIIKTGKLPQQSLRTLKDIVAARVEFKKGKSDSHKIDDARKAASLLINDLVDFSQRKDLMEIEKTRMRLKYSKDNKTHMAELIVSDGESFLVNEGVIKKITGKIENSNMEELSKSVQDRKGKQNFNLKPKVFELLKKELGDFEIIL
ncbi:MAG: hypothetical protein IIB81_05175 [Nanoarchaeota archaeon]|nr:hypothetical protein [Nanoarchaeota archaeon]